MSKGLNWAAAPPRGEVVERRTTGPRGGRSFTHVTRWDNSESSEKARFGASEDWLEGAARWLRVRREGPGAAMDGSSRAVMRPR